MISMRAAVGLLGTWAEASHTRALANAREASVERSRARLERAEVETYLADRAPTAADLATRTEAASR